MSRRTAVCAALILAAALAIQCDSRKDEVDLDNQRALYLLAQRLSDPSLTDYNSRCLEAVQAGFDCASTAGSAALYRDGFLLAATGQTLSGSNAQICAIYSEADPLRALSPGLRVCYFRCERDYWQQSLGDGACAAANYDATSDAAEAALTACTSSCGSVSTPIP